MSRPRSARRAISAPAAAAPIPTAYRRGRGAALERDPGDVADGGAGRGARAGWPRCRCIWSRRSARLRIGIVHGDAAALAGWRFAQDALDDPKRRAWLADVARAPRRSTCSPRPTPASRRCATSRCAGGRLTVINNGAAGMPNFAGTRLRRHHAHRHDAVAAPAALRPATRRRSHRRAWRSTTTSDAFLDRFLKRWPQGSPAHASYYRRIVDGPDYHNRAGGAAMKLSIVMPVLDEAAEIEAALRRWRPIADAASK